MKKNRKILILLGPTASGKSDVALQVIKKFTNLQIINCDSKQIYKEIPIITAQPEREEIEEYGYKLYGHQSVYFHYNVASWLRDAEKEIENAFQNDKIPFFVGGTGFYIHGLMNEMSNLPEISEEIRERNFALLGDLGLEGYYEYLISRDKKIIGRINKNDKYRLHRAACVFDESGKSIFDFYEESKIRRKNDYEYFINVLLPDREILYSNIEKRFHIMLNNGLLGEVKEVVNIPRHLPSYKSHGLPELIDYLNGKRELDDAINIAIKNTRNYAKRQTTWFRHQLDDANFFDNKESCIESFFEVLRD